MAGMMDPIVRFEAVTKRFGDTLAVDRLELDIARGEFVTLLGPSGCGKSTTLRMLGGFETPSAGRVLLDGEDVTGEPPYRRDVNMVFQDYALFPHMSVAENVAFGLEMKGFDRTTIAARVNDLLGLVQLSEMAARLPEQLSGGQRQRIALARALAPDPKVLLLDEPLGALDAKLRQQMQIELKHIQEQTGKTFLFVTHDQEEALTMSDTVVVMNAGRIEQMGSPAELYHRPKGRFVASFIGDTNLLTCEINGAEGTRLRLNWAGTSLLADAPDAALSHGRTVQVALRPDHIVCSWHEPETENRVAGRIVERVFKGARTNLVVDAGRERRLEVRVDPFFLEQGGDEVWLGWQPERMVVLAD
jgi:spermidine/putrescine transport system ATP-binding protein